MKDGNSAVLYTKETRERSVLDRAVVAHLAHSRDSTCVSGSLHWPTSVAHFQDIWGCSLQQAFEAMPKLDIRKRTESTDLPLPPTWSFLLCAVKYQSSPGICAVELIPCIEDCRILVSVHHHHSESCI